MGEEETNAEYEEVEISEEVYREVEAAAAKMGCSEEEIVVAALRCYLVTPEAFNTLVEYTIACRALVEYLFLLAEEGRFMPAGEERFRELGQIFKDTRAAWVKGIVHGPG